MTPSLRAQRNQAETDNLSPEQAAALRELREGTTEQYTEEHQAARRRGGLVLFIGDLHLIDDATGEHHSHKKLNALLEHLRSLPKGTYQKVIWMGDELDAVRGKKGAEARIAEKRRLVAAVHEALRFEPSSLKSTHYFITGNHCELATTEASAYFRAVGEYERAGGTRGDANAPKPPQRLIDREATDRLQKAWSEFGTVLTATPEASARLVVDANGRIHTEAEARTKGITGDRIVVSHFLGQTGYGIDGSLPSIIQRQGKGLKEPVVRSRDVIAEFHADQHNPSARTNANALAVAADGTPTKLYQSYDVGTLGSVLVAENPDEPGKNLPNTILEFDPKTQQAFHAEVNEDLAEKVRAYDLPAAKKNVRIPIDVRDKINLRRKLLIITKTKGYQTFQKFLKGLSDLYYEDVQKLIAAEEERAAEPAAVMKAILMECSKPR